MSITDEQIRRVAHLARVQIADKDLPVYAKSLSNIFNLVEKMSDVAIDQVLPMAHPRDLDQPLRPDEITEPDVRQAMLEIAPMTEQGLYLVPQVIEESA